jgi:HJR/Mrr/RecB family endonuclease
MNENDKVGLIAERENENMFLGLWFVVSVGLFIFNIIFIVVTNNVKIHGWSVFISILFSMWLLFMHFARTRKRRLGTGEKKKESLWNLLIISIVLFTLVLTLGSGDPFVGIVVFAILLFCYIIIRLIIYIFVLPFKSFTSNEGDKRNQEYHKLVDKIATQPVEYTLSKNSKYNEIPVYRVGYASTAKVTTHTLAEIDEMDGFKFEKYIKGVFESLGYSVHHTPLSGDQGADLILTSKEGIKTAVQVKRYSSKVSNGAVQEVVAAKGFHKCTECMVITNNFFTDSAKQLANANGVDLIDKNELKKLISKALQTVYQDQEWIQHLHRSSSLLNGYFQNLEADLKNLDYANLANFVTETRKIMDENSQYSTSPRLQDARKEWGAALVNFNSMGVYTISNGKLTPEANTNFKLPLESGFDHLNRANAATKINT